MVFCSEQELQRVRIVEYWAGAMLIAPHASEITLYMSSRQPYVPAIAGPSSPGVAALSAIVVLPIDDVQGWFWHIARHGTFSLMPIFPD